MADEALDAAAGEEGGSAIWRRGWVGIAALLATLSLIALVVMVSLSNRARDDALAYERHAYDVMLLTRTVDATIARAEAALGRFVMDELQGTGTIYYTEWRRAGRQIAELQRQVSDVPEQAARVGELRRLYEQRGRELAVAATAAARRTGAASINFYYQAGQSDTLKAIRAGLDRIDADERARLQRRMAETRNFDMRADRLTGWLGWLAVFIALGAVLLGFFAYRALTERVLARREAENEAVRAGLLEQKVEERTRELKEANERLRAEAAERAVAEAQLRQIQKMEAVGQLTGGIAHDFNNMLAVVVGGLDLARRRLHGPRRDVEYHLDNALEGATRAAALTRRLLAFARAEPLLPEGIAPAELIENMLDLVDRTIGERIAVHTSFPEEPWHVWADSNQLENAIVNLCVNARDAMEGSGELRIAVDNVEVGAGEIGELEPGPYVRIAVADTGAGIAPEHLERVFEPFFTTKPVGKGTGLGLSQIFGFARESGGDVAIESEMGKGTTVAIYLPRSIEAAEQAAHRAAPARVRSGFGEREHESAVILVVEDDPRVSRSTVAALEELGYIAIACSSGAEALETLGRNDRIDLVVTDVMMPEMTGPELIREMSRTYPDIGVLFVTGYVGDAGEAEDLSGYDILRKPFTVAALADSVATALGREVSESPPASKAAATG
ncbi:response regulator [Allosphingosinicella sp.]|jgi:signal transduction histidine kinase/CheY-like chemotaxis protein|uniref:hybrid sensor histidine kinase/response regulator n=1 Tax=Allosphingosinicella sp. TaxID=2823234 RepID=UPI002F160419